MNQIDLEQAITDGLGAIAVALCAQLDATRFAADLKILSTELESAGNGPSAGLVAEIARTVESRAARKN